MKNALVLFLFSIITSVSWAQKSKIEPIIFDKSDGFELSKVHTMVSDDDGFLWMGGEDLEVRDILGNNKVLSLQRFDGVSFDNIPIPGQRGKVTKIDQIFKREDGQFYIHFVAGKKDNIVLFDPITTQFTFFNYPERKSSLNSVSPVYSFEHKNYVFIQNGEEITFYNLSDDFIYTPLFTFHYRERKVAVNDARIMFTQDHVIFSDNNMPVHIFDWKGKLLQTFSHADFGIKDITSSTQTYIDECFKHKGKHYFFLLNNPQLFTFDLMTLSVKPVEGVQMESDNLYVLQKGPVIRIVNRKDKNLGIYSIAESISADIKFDTLYDAEGNRDDEGIQYAFSRNLSDEMWVVTSDHRLLYFSIEKKPINSVLEDHSIRGLYDFGENRVLVATEYGGWFSFNYKTNEVQHKPLQYNGKEYSASGSRGFIKLGRELWSSSYSRIMHMNLDTKEVFESKYHPITCLTKRNEEQIIYGTGNYQLLLYDIPSQKHIVLLETDSLEIIDVKVHNDWIIAGTDKGILLYQFSTKQGKLIQPKAETLDRYILCVSDYKKGVYMLGTQQGMIIRFDVKTQKMKLMYQDELKAGIAGFLVDDKNLWWISTFNGLVCFNPKTKETQRYSTLNGLSNNEANRYSSLKVGGLLFFGAFTGLNYFSADQLRPQPDKAKLALMMSEVFDEKVDDFKVTLDRKSLNNQQEFVLPAVQRSLRLKFAIKNGNISGKYTIKYRLNEGRWTVVDRSNAIYFSNLAPGDYTVEVELLNFSGKSIGQHLKYKIKVKGFFYEQPWFYLVLALITLSIVGWYFLEQRKQKKMRENFSENLIVMQESERERISKELHDSVGQQLTLLKKTAQNRDQKELSELANNTLEEVRSISKNLHPPLLKELGLTDSIRTLINAFDEETSVFFTTDLADIDLYFNETGALHVYRFVQEGLSNMLKHAQARSALVEITILGGKYVHLVIEDDGIGMKNGIKSFSLGMTTMQERIRILNGIFTIEKLNKGTRLLAKIPIT